MKTALFKVLFLLLAGFSAVNGQPLRQAGLYGITGNLAMDSKINTMVLGGGDIVVIPIPDSRRSWVRPALGNPRAWCW